MEQHLPQSRDGLYSDVTQHGGRFVYARFHFDRNAFGKQQVFFNNHTWDEYSIFKGSTWYVRGCIASGRFDLLREAVEMITLCRLPSHRYRLLRPRAICYAAPYAHTSACASPLPRWVWLCQRRLPSQHTDTCALSYGCESILTHKHS